jgi:FMN phosphatase YigB (HAD superfamily)
MVERLWQGRTMPLITPVRVVFFDFGFTLWDKERTWTEWARWLRIPTPEFFAVLGSVIERREHHHRTFEIFRPGIDLAQEREQRLLMGQSDAFRSEELYPDVLPCLDSLRRAGYQTGLAGNQFGDFAEALRKMKVSVDFLGSSEEWRVEKPSQGFFLRIVQIARAVPGEIA